jgi:hypothetical protein
MTIQESERVGTEPVTNIFKYMQDSWEDFVIRNNLFVAVGSDALFEFFCNMFCQSMRPQLQIMIKNYTEELERKRQSRRST